MKHHFMLLRQQLDDIEKWELSTEAGYTARVGEWRMARLDKQLQRTPSPADQVAAAQKQQRDAAAAHLAPPAAPRAASAASSPPAEEEGDVAADAAHLALAAPPASAASSPPAEEEEGDVALLRRTAEGALASTFDDVCRRLDAAAPMIQLARDWLKETLADARLVDYQLAFTTLCQAFANKTPLGALDDSDRHCVGVVLVNSQRELLKQWRQRRNSSDPALPAMVKALKLTRRELTRAGLRSSLGEDDPCGSAGGGGRGRKPGGSAAEPPTSDSTTTAAENDIEYESNGVSAAESKQTLEQAQLNAYRSITTVRKGNVDVEIGFKGGYAIPDSEKMRDDIMKVLEEDFFGDDGVLKQVYAARARSPRGAGGSCHASVAVAPYGKYGYLFLKLEAALKPHLDATRYVVQEFNVLHYPPGGHLSVPSGHKDRLVSDWREATHVVRVMPGVSSSPLVFKLGRDEMVFDWTAVEGVGPLTVSVIDRAFNSQATHYRARDPKQQVPTRDEACTYNEKTSSISIALWGCHLSADEYKKYDSKKDPYRSAKPPPDPKLFLEPATSETIREDWLELNKPAEKTMREAFEHAVSEHGYKVTSLVPRPPQPPSSKRQRVGLPPPPPRQTIDAGKLRLVARPSAWGVAK